MLVLVEIIIVYVELLKSSLDVFMAKVLIGKYSTGDLLTKHVAINERRRGG